MLVWVVTIGRIDAAHATSSLSRFTACPRQGHLERLFRVFGYLKKRPNRRIVVDYREPIYEGGQDALDMDYNEELGDHYQGEIVAASIEKLKEDYRREGSGNYPGLVLSRHSSLSTIGRIAATQFRAGSR
jgi:hypothetical protein